MGKQYICTPCGPAGGNRNCSRNDRLPAAAGHAFAISDITESSGLVSVGRVYFIQPSPTQFASPVTLSVTLPVDPEDIWVELRGEDLSLARLCGDRWEPLETTYDPITRTLSAQFRNNVLQKLYPIAALEALF